MRIIGIDPGLATTGIGLVNANNGNDVEAKDWLTIETSPGIPTPERLKEIEADLSEYLSSENPDLAVVEKLYFSVNEKTAIDVAQARGVMLATLSRHSIEILEPTPAELKKCITGDGGADKRQIQDMLMAMFKLDSPPTPDDAADALALATFGAFQKQGIMLAANR